MSAQGRWQLIAGTRQCNFSWLEKIGSGCLKQWAGDRDQEFCYGETMHDILDMGLTCLR